MSNKNHKTRFVCKNLLFFWVSRDTLQIWYDKTSFPIISTYLTDILTLDKSSTWFLNHLLLYLYSIMYKISPNQRSILKSFDKVENVDLKFNLTYMTVIINWTWCIVPFFTGVINRNCHTIFVLPVTIIWFIFSPIGVPGRLSSTQKLESRTKNNNKKISK